MDLASGVKAFSLSWLLIIQANLLNAPPHTFNINVSADFWFMTVDKVFAKIPVYIRSDPNFVYLLECRCDANVCLFAGLLLLILRLSFQWCGRIFPNLSMSKVLKKCVVGSTKGKKYHNAIKCLLASPAYLGRNQCSRLQNSGNGRATCNMRPL